MTTPYDMNKIMHRVKNLQEFTITRDLPEHFEFNGQVPYDMKISNNIAHIKVYAVDLAEANKRVDDFLEV